MASAEKTGLADLHRHLDGSLRDSTVHELADELGREVPADLRFTSGMGLQAALARFQFMLGLLRSPAALQRVADEICQDAAAEGVTTLEIRFAPQLHGDDWAASIDAVLGGVARRAGVILCGLYGEPPSVLRELVRLGRDRPGVVGVDLAGAPSADHSWDMRSYAPAFEAAARAGLGRTVHAGEGRPPQEIAVAVTELLANRIGHGTTLLEAPDVVDLVLSRDVTIEACPTSNVQTGVIERIGDHPLGRWLELGVSVCVCPDNTFFSAVSASDELGRVCAALDLDALARARLIECGHRAAFAR